MLKSDHNLSNLLEEARQTVARLMVENKRFRESGAAVAPPRLAKLQ
jgi:hypothetical protein